MGTGKPLDGKRQLEQKTILKSYFKAFSEEFPKEWTDRKNFVLTKAQGIQLICSLFPNIHQRCLLYEKKELTVDAFRRQIDRLKQKKITLPDGRPTSINWSKKDFSPFTSGKAMKWLKRELLKALPPYEETAGEEK